MLKNNLRELTLSIQNDLLDKGIEGLNKLIEELSSLNYNVVIDTHCHLESEIYDNKNREKVITRAIKNRVMMITTPLTTREREVALELKSRYNNWIHLVTGSHPLIDENTEVVIDFIEKNRKVIVGVGEVGLDFKPPNNQLHIMKKQIEKFEFFIDVAKDLDLPLVIHSRSAGRQVLEVLIRKKAERVLLHAFSGNVKYVRKGLQAGYYFTASTTSLRNAQKIRLVKTVPLEQLMLETDSPVLPPADGVVNEPVYVLISAFAASKIKNEDIINVIEATTFNAKEFFGI